jgi:hypothetical protein
MGTVPITLEKMAKLRIFHVTSGLLQEIPE